MYDFMFTYIYTYTNIKIHIDTYTFQVAAFLELDVVLVVPGGMVDSFDGSICIYIHTYRNMFTHFHTIIVCGCFLGIACTAMGWIRLAGSFKF